MSKKNKKKLVQGAPSLPLLKAPKFLVPREVKRDIAAVILFTLGLLSLLSFLGYAGEAGNRVFNAILYLFGWGFWIIPFLFFAIGIFLIKGPKVKDEATGEETVQTFSNTILAGAAFFTLSFLGLLNSLWTPSQMTANVALGRGGGYIGLILAWPLVHFINSPAAMLVLVAILVISILLIFNLTLATLARSLKGLFFPRVPAVITEETVGSGIIKNEETASAGPAGISPKITVKEIIKKAMPGFKIKPVADEAPAEEKAAKIPEPDAKASETPAADKKTAKKRNLHKWEIPLNLLDKEDGIPNSGDIGRNSEIIKKTLENFGIDVEMGNINVGPTVTQYTLRPSIGVKLSRITNLANDLALALAAHPLRIEAPIPGKSLVGLEIPNRAVARVRLRGLMESLKAKRLKSSLNIILGQDVTGNAIVDDLGKMPHLLIAGATGSGKTIGVNSIIIALLFQNSPEQLRFIMVDPKRVELSMYNDIPHLLTPVITEPTKAVNSLKWAINEMDRRYNVLSAARVRDIYSYNANGFDEKEALPFIVIIIDELADLMMRFGREMEASIVRLAQMSRAVGIHLIISTQRPSVEVITGLIKANITARIAFQVASVVDSRTILDTGGAEKLLGRGDMLYIAQDSHKPKRIQGAYLSEEEIKRIVEYIKQVTDQEEFAGTDAYAVKESPSDFHGGLNPAEFMSNVESAADMGDELYQEAKKLVIEAKKASASLLQRRLRVGYARAARLLDLLEEQGVIGPQDGAKPREVYENMAEGNGEIKEDEDSI